MHIETTHRDDKLSEHETDGGIQVIGASQKKIKHATTHTESRFRGGHISTLAILEENKNSQGAM